MLRDHNEERRAVKQTFMCYRKNRDLLSVAPAAAEGAQLALEWVSGGDWIAVDDLELQKAEAKRYNQKVEECVYQYLSRDEIQIVKLSYMTGQRLVPIDIFEPLNIERTLYYTMKAKAVAKLYVAFKMQKLLRKSTDDLLKKRS